MCVCSNSQYDMSAMRALDENLMSQLDLSEDATAVAMKRLSMWQEKADTGPPAARSTAMPSAHSMQRFLQLTLRVWQTIPSVHCVIHSMLLIHIDLGSICSCTAHTVAPWPLFYISSTM